ncbi:HAMP domain-containing sensor histidine kinase [Alkalimonas delamerensis]|uniref:histidine kinase n=1 Tax=Alkalimonas delamerensis TaxID=265981 RepID=A0ABT9GQZ2_9GAMM|nr:HAMP domain-containing sensor histidine kinase [Alkalimonas delamerensis]MDP4529076.1 HAMP domain-containing sensor histidine kinase [Alkalimonas delamerensis]
MKLQLLQTASLRQLVLSSFVLALIPVAVLMWQSHRALTGISQQAVEQASTSAASVRRMEQMQNQVVDIERAIRQFAVLKTEALARLAQNHLASYQQLLPQVCQSLSESSLCQQQELTLQQLHQSFTQQSADQLEPLLQQLRQQQSRLSQQIWQQLELQLATQQRDVASAQQQLTWQTILLVFLTLLLVIWGSRRITSPVTMLERMIRAIGRQQPFPEARVQGPKELTELGEQLRVLAGRLHQLESLRLILLRHASHELKTPLSSIREGCSLLTEELVGPLTPQQQEVVALLNGSADRLSQLTEQLLDYNRLLQQAKPELKWHPARAMIEACVQDHTLALQQRGQAVQLRCEPDKLFTDAVLFRRILDNLINNVQAYGAENSEVHIRLYARDHCWWLEVANQGQPIAPEQRERLFEPFQRGQTQRHDQVQGSGLGLSIVADCARLLGGKADIVDAPPADFCVRIRLPMPGEGE